MHETAIRAVGAVVALAMSLPVRADAVVLGPIRDNTLFSTTTTSNGAGDGVFSGRTGGGGVVQRAVLDFDIAGHVPAGATITSVELTLTLLAAGSPPAQVHDLRRVLADWGEGTSSAGGGSGAPATPGDATWLHTFFPSAFWTNPGGDFADTVSAARTVGSEPGAYAWSSTPQLVADAQEMLDNPGSDHGWLLRGNEEALQTARKFASREHPDPAVRPRLTVEFDPPACFQVLEETIACDGGGELFTYTVQGADSCSGGTSAYSFTASAGAVGESLCFTLLIAGDGGGYCCTTELCVTIPDCSAPVPGDLDGDGLVGLPDLLLQLGAWGSCSDCAGCPADLDGSCAVDFADLLELLASWG